ncbi:density-regulated protein [Thamnophis elegans]|uniref:density-regulated protein n=1 Tax=Thamnophis elegans TaxID=35005 RepID=UPI0013779264|nr:density-regulated protein [Thamnophis elegans]
MVGGSLPPATETPWGGGGRGGGEKKKKAEEEQLRFSLWSGPAASSGASRGNGGALARSPACLPACLPTCLLLLLLNGRPSEPPGGGARVWRLKGRSPVSGETGRMETAVEPVVLDCRGDQRCNARPDVDYPLRVLYCGVCSLPTEYCEYMPDMAKCRQWLEKNFPNEFAKLTAENCPKQESGIGEGQGMIGEEEEKKKQKRGGRGQIKQKKKTVPQKVTIAKIPRAKKKYVTRVCGLATFEIDLKEAQRFFAQKFSCGASVTGEDEIIIQGDFTDDIIEVIQEKWPEVDDDSIEDLGEVKK